jgi:hypothetical protein
MDRDGEGTGIGPEDRLGAVAMVDVPVDEGDPLGEALRLGVTAGDRGVGEDAEAERLVALGVMARTAAIPPPAASVAIAAPPEPIAVREPTSPPPDSLTRKTRSRCALVWTRRRSSSPALSAAIGTSCVRSPLTSSRLRIRRFDSGVSGWGRGSSAALGPPARTLPV